MTESEALARMISPGMRRSGKPRGGVIQILLTSSCDKSCFSCTQGSHLRRKAWFMKPEQFEQACLSLKGYFGIVGVFGGNPAISPHFEACCEILRRHFPREQCGLWCNHPMGKGRTMRETFNPSVSNLNVHLSQEAWDQFKRDWPESQPFGLTQDSRHSPPFVALRDVVIGEAERWELIAGCKINQHWSAGIGVFRGQLRAWFCEIAMAQSILHQDEPDYPDTGLKICDDCSASNFGVVWWKRDMIDFASQSRKHCHECGIPLQGRGELAQDGDERAVEQVSETHRAVFEPKRKSRRVELVTTREQLGEPLANVVRYLQNAEL